MGTKPLSVGPPFLPVRNTPIRTPGGNNHRGSRRVGSYAKEKERRLVDLASYVSYGLLRGEGGLPGGTYAVRNGLPIPYFGFVSGTWPSGHKSMLNGAWQPCKSWCRPWLLLKPFLRPRYHRKASSPETATVARMKMARRLHLRCCPAGVTGGLLIKKGCCVRSCLECGLPPSRTLSALIILSSLSGPITILTLWCWRRSRRRH